MAGTFTAHPPGRALCRADGFALWSLRYILRPEALRCPALLQRPPRGLAADLARLRAAFHRAVERHGGATASLCPVGLRHSLSVGEEETVLLHCLARLQLGRQAPCGPLETMLPDHRVLPALTDTLDALAAALALGDYWLTDPDATLC